MKNVTVSVWMSLRVASSRTYHQAVVAVVAVVAVAARFDSGLHVYGRR
eukprot:COSAG01_NODE_66052_length_271_cov_0.895349_1_plen_47_part_01